MHESNRLMTYAYDCTAETRGRNFTAKMNVAFRAAAYCSCISTSIHIIYDYTHIIISSVCIYEIKFSIMHSMFWEKLKSDTNASGNIYK